jgi:hypothetical protein
MIVICKKDSKRLIKGFSYEVLYLRNTINSRGNTGRVSIKGIGSFSVNNFSDSSGNELPKIDYTATPEEIKEFKFENLVKGDFLICKVDKYKTLIKGNTYKIESLNTTTTESKSYNGTIYTYHNHFVKFEGTQRKLKFSNWCFRPLTTGETREITLDKVLKDKDFEVIDMKKHRKIDLIKNKEEELLKVISKSLLDPNRHHLSVIEWGCRLSNLNITKDDYDCLLNLTLKDILEKIETNN